MRRLVKVLQALGINSVPVLGVFLGGWSTATALLLYWFENLLATLLVALRIARHRRLTSKRGHWAASIAASGTAGASRGNSFLGGFLITALVFTLAHGLFLALIIFLMLPQAYPEAAAVDPVDLRRGLLGVAGFLVVGLAIDLVGLARRPFSWVKRLSDRLLGRVVVVHLTIVLGMWAMAWLDGPRGLFLVFAAFKTLTDLSWLLPEAASGSTPPAWLTGIIRRLGGPAKAEDFVRYYEASHRDELSAQAQWEERA
jgi:hypothetical protein